MREVLADHAKELFAVEERLARQRLEREARKRIGVGRERALGRTIVAPHLGRRVHRVSALLPHVATAQAEVDERSRARSASQDDVVGLEIEVTHAGRVHRIDARQHTVEDLERARHRHRASRELLFERVAFDELHHEERLGARGDVEGEDAREVVVNGDRSEGRGLGAELREQLLFGDISRERCRVVRHLEHDVLRERIAFVFDAAREEERPETTARHRTDESEASEDAALGDPRWKRALGRRHEAGRQQAGTSRPQRRRTEATLRIERLARACHERVERTGSRGNVGARRARGGVERLERADPLQREVSALSIVLGEQSEHGVGKTIRAAPSRALATLDRRQELPLERVQQPDYERVVSRYQSRSPPTSAAPEATAPIDVEAVHRPFHRATFRPAPPSLDFSEVIVGTPERLTDLRRGAPGTSAIQAGPWPSSGGLALYSPPSPMRRLPLHLVLPLFPVLASLFVSPAIATADAPAAPAATATTAPISVALTATSTKLSNGLEVIFDEDRRTPIVTVNLWYHVGSKDEAEHRNGFAHLFEHVMFQGSKHVPEDTYFRFLEKAGATSINGTTSTDRTNYFETVPANQLELALWLESDRMAYLLSHADEKTFQSQREVVKNERRQNYENAPYGMVIAFVREEVYPKGHPYHLLTIGSPQDLDAATFEDVKAFFRANYVPNNATIVISGDFERSKAQPLVEKWFGPIPRGRDVPRKQATKVEHLGESRIEVEAGVELARAYITWPTPPMFAPGDGELDLVAHVLTGGKTSRLYKRLVYDLQIAQSVGASQQSAELGSVFEIVATARPGHTGDELLKVIDEELAKLRTGGVTDGELSRGRTSIVADTFFDLERSSSRANRLNSYAHYVGDPNYLAKDLARTTNATTATVAEAGRTWLKEKDRVVTIVTPNKAAPIAGKISKVTRGGK